MSLAKFKERIKARNLRKQGESISHIAKSLMVSKGTVSVWCRDIKLTERQQTRLKERHIAAGHKGRAIGAQMNKQKRIDAINSYKDLGRKEIGALSRRDLVVLASALFWAEGAKTGSRFVFINSDPDMVLCMYRYLTEVEGIAPHRFFVTIQINRIHEKRIRKVFNFWSSLLNLPLDQFGKPYYINAVPKKIYENYETYYGIARLGVRSGTGLQYKLLGYIDALKSGK